MTGSAVRAVGAPMPVVTVCDVVTRARPGPDLAGTAADAAAGEPGPRCTGLSEVMLPGVA